MRNMYMCLGAPCIVLYTEYSGTWQLSGLETVEMVIFTLAKFIQFHHKQNKNKRNAELQWKPLPALIVLPTHLEHIMFTVSIALRSCACF